jgi:hypothetical protein
LKCYKIFDYIQLSRITTTRAIKKELSVKSRLRASLSKFSLSLSLMRVSLSRQKHLCICLLYFRREGLFMANFVITLWFLWLNQRRGHCYFDLRNKIVHVSYLILCLLLFTELGLRLEGAFLFWLWWGLP